MPGRAIFSAWHKVSPTVLSKYPEEKQAPYSTNNGVIPALVLWRAHRRSVHSPLLVHSATLHRSYSSTKHCKYRWDAVDPSQEARSISPHENHVVDTPVTIDTSTHFEEDLTSGRTHNEFSA
mmetsp:Transcript_33363/g.93620  ORF Transcript_33363/g.93620 Transcript_33363/m.93620 type:complete len:122 (+) Transcript_33363:2079-2444(+)